MYILFYYAYEIHMQIGNIKYHNIGWYGGQCSNILETHASEEPIVLITGLKIKIYQVMMQILNTKPYKHIARHSNSSNFISKENSNYKQLTY